MPKIVVNPHVPAAFKTIYATNESNGFNGFGTYTLDSGRISGKTLNVGEYSFLRLISVPFANVVINRAEQNDIRDSVFATFQYLISSYFTDAEMRKYWKLSLSPFEITFLPNGNKVFFMAINGDINRTKGFQLTRKEDYIDVVWYEEINELDSESYLTAANLTYLRFFKPCSKIFQVYNPPEGRLHWANNYFPSQYKSGKAKRVYSTWEDIRYLLNPAIVEKILEDKERDYDYYRYWYLGHIISLKGLVFKQFSRAENVVSRVSKAHIHEYVSWFIIAGDGAIKNDATAFGLLAVLRSGGLLLLDSYYYDPVKENAQLADTDQARRICKWYHNCLVKYPGIGAKPFIGTVDNANYNLLCVLRLTKDMGKFKWFPATDKVIIRDTHRLQNLFYENILSISDDPTTANGIIIDEIESYVYDEKTQDIKKDQSDHGIDMLKYGTYIYANPASYNLNLEVK